MFPSHIIHFFSFLYNSWELPFILMWACHNVKPEKISVSTCFVKMTLWFICAALNLNSLSYIYIYYSLMKQACSSLVACLALWPLLYIYLAVSWLSLYSNGHLYYFYSPLWLVFLCFKCNYSLLSLPRSFK